MAQIELLNQDTIDKIAAGEVVERPASVVKELVENAIDAKASIITIEIEKGGTSKIRISDNGIGIESGQVRKAFLRHSTSKLRDASELSVVRSLGFRGEALSSIAAVSKVELITKTADEMLGTHCEIEGAVETVFEEIGAPVGSTFIIRDLFYNTLPRQKFLKSPKTEGNYICEIVEKLALSHPEIAFQLSVDNKTRLNTVGSSKLRDAIYHIYGRNVTSNLIGFNEDNELMKITGFIGNSTVVKGNRSYENVFINNRFVKSKVIASAVEESYTGYLMQHQYPFFVLMIDIDTTLVDVNVHPAKMEVRIDNQSEIIDVIKRVIDDAIHKTEGIIDVKIDVPQVDTPHVDALRVYEPQAEEAQVDEAVDDAIDDTNEKPIIEPYETHVYEERSREVKATINKEAEHVKPNMEPPVQAEQLSFLSEEAVKKHKIIGQLFSTYWLVEYDNSLYIIDQHAAHEKVLYEETIKTINDNEMSTQQISPPVVVTLSANEEAFLNDNIDVFSRIGYEIEHFGGHEYAIKGIPYNIYGVDAKTLFLDMIGDCTNETIKGDSDIILDKIASMSCKAAIKGNMDMSTEEAKRLIDDLLRLENPYHCPHGRPTIIKMSRYDIERKFGRIM